MSDQYLTIAQPSAEVLFKDKGSKFFGYAFPVDSKETIKKTLTLLKEQHPQARHFCYAFILGQDKRDYRYSDDGEPGNSAGFPIYGQLLSFDVTNVLVVVVRYFGGTKLGVSGLKSAYKTAAKMALQECRLITETLKVQFKLTFDYDLLNTVMRLIKTLQLEIVEQHQQERCTFIVAARLGEADHVLERLTSVFRLTVKDLRPA